jgi:hypothetical protein
MTVAATHGLGVPGCSQPGADAVDQRQVDAIDGISADEED